tara:strand:+ start:176 stop:1051 length:876 start_codon:yes stop_codon:yes gene_type:complete
MTIIKYGLGTAQLGQIYGITKRKKIYSTKESKKIIDLIKNNLKKIDLIDTAELYGDSEKLIGKLDTKLLKIVTKINISTNKKNLRNQIIEKFNNSLKKLNKKSIYGLLIHNPLILKKKDFQNEIFDTLIELKEKKFVKNLGLSIYNPQELEYHLNQFNYDIIQSPFNLLDQRIKKQGWLNEFKNKKIKFHARSIFLQGLLLTKKNNRDLYFNRFESFWKEWDHFILSKKIKPIDICLNFILNQKNVNRILIGVNSINELKYILKFNKNILSNFEYNKKISNSLIDPRRWQF